jgi:hypothetical protein
VRPTFAFAALVVVAVLAPRPLHAQQPFITDDAAVTLPGVFHVEFADELDWLPDSAHPSERQNTASIEFICGVGRKLETAVDVPVIAIFNTAGATTEIPVGLGDITVSGKYLLHAHADGSGGPAMTVSGSIGIPTGDKSRGLGSALVDYVVNAIFEWTPNEATALRLNAGAVLSGNTASGALGIKQRGVIVTGSGSLVRQIARRLDLGVEVAAAVNRNFDLGGGQLRAQAGGNYHLTDWSTLDFGFVAGRFAASPRIGVQVGISADVTKP